MTSRAFALASLLMIAATIASSPTTAGDVAANAGPELNAPAGHDRDFEQLLDSYATVTRSADGATTVTTASGKLREVLEREFEMGLI